VFYSFLHRQQLRKRPDTIREHRHHRRGRARRLVNTTETVYTPVPANRYGGGVLRREIWADHRGWIVRYNLAYINHLI
jgi:hypothetical protein